MKYIYIKKYINGEMDWTEKTNERTGLRGLDELEKHNERKGLMGRNTFDG